jgi:hypothetical protein
MAYQETQGECKLEPASYVSIGKALAGDPVRLPFRGDLGEEGIIENMPLRYFVWVVACKTSGRLKSNLPAIK